MTQVLFVLNLYPIFTARRTLNNVALLLLLTTTDVAVAVVAATGALMVVVVACARVYHTARGGKLTQKKKM